MVHYNISNVSLFLISGGHLFSQVPAKKPVIFIGFFEESHHVSGHFQAVVPTRDNDVLRTIRENGGFDMADYLGLKNNDDTGEFYTVDVL